MTLIDIRPTIRKCTFEDMLGNTYEGDVPDGGDADDLCCKMVRDFGASFRCYPTIIETSSGMKQGELVV